MTCPFCPPLRDRMVFVSAPGRAALVNLKPILNGHSLIVPERHVGRLGDLPADEVAGLAGFAHRVSAFLMDHLGASGIDWTLQDGPEAGQTVMHLHLHLIPRLQGDLPEPGDWYAELRASHARPAMPDHELRAAVDRLRRAAGRSRARFGVGAVVPEPVGGPAR